MSEAYSEVGNNQFGDNYHGNSDHGNIHACFAERVFVTLSDRVCTLIEILKDKLIFFF